MTLGLHSLLFLTKVKADSTDGGVRVSSGTETEASAIMSCDQALDALIRYRSRLIDHSIMAS